MILFVREMLRYIPYADVLLRFQNKLTLCLVMMISSIIYVYVYIYICMCILCAYVYIYERRDIFKLEYRNFVMFVKKNRYFNFLIDKYWKRFVACNLI